ncbi:hypothetical protein CHS0354_020051 [Potamilus streckersoni]|uniref:Uncharacterized protein n=1 Tax=Potamilus streckersoni TaxID=2493646 RepID=A0AAE0VXW4_9BIVA|nr:hypothetical protein CHS0354_020049 [Potamilus streckersoni]KAK3594166.1 hypothetical protein CHS0354_020050 [Potamilus streckersoni]KAK3594167.1 hypothetical protein CHS0354_020051 [Potamilus streckersoni]
MLPDQKLGYFRTGHIESYLPAPCPSQNVRPNGKGGVRVPLPAWLHSPRRDRPATANRTQIPPAVLEIQCGKHFPRDDPGRAFGACGKQACGKQKLVSRSKGGV